ncbi:hypothetical protein BS78_03G375000 [Paspalum vaginatum]|nr:hypothetical protein BS78_03G375000 [Paspalum vaginatum]KAJ1286737.1 hypothetical protein BS78_03G375000 [Paspalum vaginatum]
MADLTLPSPPLPATPPASSSPSSIPAGSPQLLPAESPPAGLTLQLRPAARLRRPRRLASTPGCGICSPGAVAAGGLLCSPSPSSTLSARTSKSLQRLHARYRAPPTQPVTAHGPASWAGDLWSAPAISAPPLVDLLLLFYLHSSRAVASPSLLISQEINSCTAHFFLLRCLHMLRLET